MRSFFVAAATAALFASAGASALAEEALCFDKATLSYTECPKAPAPAPQPDPVHDWSGFYLGAHAGYGWFPNDVDFDLEPAFGPIFAGAGLPTTLDYIADGAVLGAQVGYNHQIETIVIGVEADIAWSWIDGSDSASGVFSQVVGDTARIDIPLTLRSETDIDWLSTIRLRGGFTPTPEALVYLTGGLAIADVGRTDSLTAPTVGWGFDESDVRYGFTIGGGLEYALDEDWSVKGEYLYMDLGSESGVLGPISGATTTTCCSSKDDLTGHLLRIGLNYSL